MPSGSPPTPEPAPAATASRSSNPPPPEAHPLPMQTNEAAPQAAQKTPAITLRALAPGDDTTAFRTLNEEWITRFFTLEAKDRETLGDPERTILQKGGAIFLALVEGEAV